MPNEALRLFFKKMEAQGLMLTYEDVRLRTKSSEVLPRDTKLYTRFSRRVLLNMPIVSSPMDTVTTAPMAIAMAEAGGLGVIHRNLDPEAQAREVGRVKHRLHGRIETPITVPAHYTVRMVLELREDRHFPFNTFPVVSANNEIVGLLTRNDFDFCKDVEQGVTEVMTPKEDLVTAEAKTTQQQAYDLMCRRKRKVLPLVDGGGRLQGMYLFSDLKRILAGGQMHSTDMKGQLLVAAAVGAGDMAFVRAKHLAQKHCDVFVIDTAHGDSAEVLQTIQALKQAHPHIDVVAGNVSSGSSALRLVEAGADGILVGQGPGSICTTRVVAGVGVPQVSAVYECVEALQDKRVPVCADGGINNSGDMVTALAVGASTVMLGRLLAGTEESPGETHFYQGMQVKAYRGMGSLGAMQDSVASRARYKQGETSLSKLVPEGVEGVVPHKGPVGAVLDQYIGGIRSGMGYLGAKTLRDLADRAELFRISSAGLRESHPHDVTITRDAPNYRR